MINNHPTKCQACESHSKGVFCDLQGTDLAQIDSVKTMNTYKKHQVLFYEGNDAMGIFCILRGRIKLYKSDSEGHHKIVKILGPGDVTGYRAVLSNEPSSATAEALEDSEICFVDRDEFLKLLKQHPETAYRVMSRLASDLGKAQDHEIQLVHKSVKERFAELLLALSHRFGKESDAGLVLDISLTRQEIADLIGTTLESAIRTMSDFRKKEIISVDKRAITLVDLEQIKEIANLPI